MNSFFEPDRMTRGRSCLRFPTALRGVGLALASMAVLLAADVAEAKDGDDYTVPMSVDEIDPERLDAARRYFAMPSMQSLSAARHDPRAIARRFENGLPKGYMTESQREAVIAMATEEFSGIRVERDETMIRVIAHVYTVEELEALIAFEETEIGRRIAEKRAIYSVLVKEATASLNRDAMSRIMERLTGFKTEPEQ